MKSALRRVRNSFSGYGIGYAHINQLGLRLLGAVYLIAFASYAVQADGLVGSRGLTPFAPALAALKPRMAEIGYHHVPTLLWFWPSDEGLRWLLRFGVAFSVLLIAGFLPALTAAVLWILYLSAVTVGGIFWSYQWDNLLLEAGFIAIWASPWRVRMKWIQPQEPPRAAVFLFHWLAFKIMFLSGYVKLASGDPSWRDLTALTYHYWTQPLPTWTAWHVHHLPLWVHKLSCAAMFGIELILPFFIWLGSRLRAIASAGFILLMALIAATGNYTFFNLLTAIVSLWLIPDRYWRQLGGWLLQSCRRGTVIPPSAAQAGPETPTANARKAVPPYRAHTAMATLSALVAVGLSLPSVAASLRAPLPWPSFYLRAVEAVAPLRTFNNYGLFAVMTKKRPEIILEGSWDGTFWVPYEFRWKPGDPFRRPGWVAPHQPRLDWQMWFAALSDVHAQAWLVNLMIRLLENEPAALNLLAYNPFEQRPPRMIRAVVYLYRFTTPEERAATGAWWAREYRGLYAPPLNLEPM